MANARGKSIDNTHLSIDQAAARGFIHRDYLAHCLRWTHIAKFLREKNRYKTAVILDVGCGRDLPLARMLHTDRITPADYLGVDYNKTSKLNAYEHNFGDKPFRFLGGVSFPNGVDIVKARTGFRVKNDSDEPYSGAHYPPSVITCFEVLEHVEPAHARAMVSKIYELAALRDEGCDIFISTPNWDPKVGAADNHVNEMKYEAVGYLLESEGLEIVNHWGTFASQKDYDLCDNFLESRQLGGSLGPEGKVLVDLWDELSQYYDSNYLATIFAPLFPAQARNCLWHCRVADDNYQPFFSTPDVNGDPFTSSEKWKELAK